MEIIEISSSSEDENIHARPTRKQPSKKTLENVPSQVIEISSDSESESAPSGLGQPLTRKKMPKPRPLKIVEKERPLPLYADEDSDDELESELGAILHLNEPRSARKPITLISRTNTIVFQTPNIFKTPTRKHHQPSSSASENTSPLVGPKSSARSLQAKATPRAGSKKAAAAAAQAHREVYARELFDTLNTLAFDGGLPKETKLTWSKTLLTTAGRAKWHRSKEGVHTTEIELAVKVLDSDERIRNTLSHEMCHLACWVINASPKEGHGRIFKAWATKVMRVRPDIEVTTKHNYEISYPYEWKCEQCSKIYGRFSKSIRPDECLCGACKVGRLIPLFTTRTRTPKTPGKETSGMSRMAAGSSQGSPYIRSLERVVVGHTGEDSDEEGGMGVLAAMLGGVRLD